MKNPKIPTRKNDLTAANKSERTIPDADLSTGWPMMSVQPAAITLNWLYCVLDAIEDETTRTLILIAMQSLTALNTANLPVVDFGF